MARLTAEERDKLPKKDFALSGGRYPIENEAHARNALARVAQHGTPAEKARVRAAVHKKFPQIKEEHEGASKEISRRLDSKPKDRR